MLCYWGHLRSHLYYFCLLLTMDCFIMLSVSMRNLNKKFVPLFGCRWLCWTVKINIECHCDYRICFGCHYTHTYVFITKINIYVYCINTVHLWLLILRNSWCKESKSINVCLTVWAFSYIHVVVFCSMRFVPAGPSQSEYHSRVRNQLYDIFVGSFTCGNSWTLSRVTWP